LCHVIPYHKKRSGDSPTARDQKLNLIAASVTAATAKDASKSVCNRLNKEANAGLSARSATHEIAVTISVESVEHSAYISVVAITTIERAANSVSVAAASSIKTTHYVDHLIFLFAGSIRIYPTGLCPEVLRADFLRYLYYIAAVVSCEQFKSS
jgi:hypothetical protein